MEIYNFQCCIIYLCFYIFKGILFLTKMGHGVPTNKHETLERFFLHGNVGDVGFTLRKIISKIVLFFSPGLVDIPTFALNMKMLGLEMAPAPWSFGKFSNLTACGFPALFPRGWDWDFFQRSGQRGAGKMF